MRGNGRDILSGQGMTSQGKFAGSLRGQRRQDAAQETTAKVDNTDLVFVPNSSTEKGTRCPLFFLLFFSVPFSFLFTFLRRSAFSLACDRAARDNDWKAHDNPRSEQMPCRTCHRQKRPNR
jgi:hypothetical protein